MNQKLSVEALRKYHWGKNGEWNEQWYGTELCFLALYSNPLTSNFYTQKIPAIAINREWYYEKNKYEEWNRQQLEVIYKECAFYRNLIKIENKYYQNALHIYSELVADETVNLSIIAKYKDALISLWYIFLADIGKHLDKVIDDLLKDEPLSEEDIEKIKNHYLTCHIPLGYFNEQEDIDLIYSEISKEYDLNDLQFGELSERHTRMLNQHAENFSWISTADIDSIPTTARDYFDNMKSAITKKINTITHLPIVDEKIISIIRPDKVLLLESMNELLALDNLAADLYGKLSYRCQNLLSKFGGVSFKEVSWYSWSEIEQLVKKRVILTRSQISQRKKNRVMLQIDGRVYTYYTKRIYDQIKQYLPKDNDKNTDSVQGVRASMGVKSGIAKIVKNIQDMHKVNTGDIIVAITTRPDLMPALRKCAAIVTDSGGVTSHAAIVARELKIPCVVGSKNATKIFHDGDFIQVDANTGLVIKL